MKTPVTHLTRQARHEFEMDAIAACFIGGTAVTGGIGTIPGAMVGGLVIGVVESLTKAYIGTITGGVITSAFSDAIVFGILIIVLLVKPSGLMGEPETEKV